MKQEEQNLEQIFQDLNPTKGRKHQIKLLFRDECIPPWIRAKFSQLKDKVKILVQMNRKDFFKIWEYRLVKIKNVKEKARFFKVYAHRAGISHRL